MSAKNPEAKWIKAFLAGHLRCTGKSWQEEGSLAPLLQERVALAQKRWPMLQVETEVFCEYLGGRALSEQGGEGLAQLQVSDLLLACACCSGASHMRQKAIVAFEEHCHGELERGLARLSLTADLRDEIGQSLMSRLFLSEEEGKEGIRKYSGRGPLQAWYRVTALREGLDLVRRQTRKREVHSAIKLEDRMVSLDPELEYLKQRYRSHFKEAFKFSLENLSCEDRNMLRHQVLGGLTLSEIGTIYSLHLSSVARRLQRIRNLLLDATASHLQRELGVDERELASIMRLIQSQLEVSLARVL